ncbi:hypothetical protein GGI42DRAFT_30379 [Trichoderma sp. SZMC 28013]
MEGHNCVCLMWELIKGKLRSLVRQQQHLNRPGTPAGAGTGDHSKPWSLAGNEKIRETAEPALARGQRRYVRILVVLEVPPSGCTVHGTWAQACKRRSASRGPAQGLQFWAWLGPPGEGQRAGHQPSTVAYQQASDGLEGRGQESRSDANPSPNYLKGAAASCAASWNRLASASASLVHYFGPVSSANWLAIPHSSPRLAPPISPDPLPYHSISPTYLFTSLSASYLSSLPLSPTKAHPQGTSSKQD